MDVSFFVKEEEKKLNAFLDQKINPPMPEISPEDLEKFSQLGFNLHYLPPLEIKGTKKFPGWKEGPKENFYQLIEKGKLAKSAGFLPGKWVLVEKRQKPRKNYRWIARDDFSVLVLEKLFKINFKGRCQKISRQQYDNDFLLPILKTNGFRSRFSLTWQEINKTIKPEAAKFLEIELEKIRLPRFIEWNFLGNVFYPGWGKTMTWEWFNDGFKTGECLTGGSGGLNIIGWDPPDFWSTMLGFRLLIEI